MKKKDSVMSVDEQLKLYSAVSGRHTDNEDGGGDGDVLSDEVMDSIASLFEQSGQQVAAMLSLYGIPNVWDLPGDSGIWQVARILHGGSSEVLVEFVSIGADGVRTRTERFDALPGKMREDIMLDMVDLMTEVRKHMELKDGGGEDGDDKEDVPPLAYIDDDPVYDSEELSECLHDILVTEIGCIYDDNVGEWGETAMDNLEDLLLVNDCFEIYKDSSGNPDIYRIYAVSRLKDGGDLILVGDRWRTRNARLVKVAAFKAMEASLGVLTAVLHRLEEWLDDGDGESQAEA